MQVYWFVCCCSKWTKADSSSTGVADAGLLVCVLQQVVGVQQLLFGFTVLCVLQLHTSRPRCVSAGCAVSIVELATAAAAACV